MKSLITPKRLRKGDTILFVSPSAGLAPHAMHRIEQARSFLEEKGFKVKYAEHSLESKGYVSASAEDRAKDLNAAFADTDVAGIICTIGGNHSNQVLKHMDWDLIRDNPKIFVGYSDISVLHYAMAQRANLRTYYGPCVMTQFGEYPETLKYTWDTFQRALCSDDEVLEVAPSDFWTDEVLNWFERADLERPRELTANDGYRWLREGRSSGALLGGCLPSILHLAGTDDWIDPSNSIFFIDIPEGSSMTEGLSLSEVDSCFAHLDNMGVFDKISGLILGRPYRYSDDQFTGLCELVERYCGKEKYPILAQANIGHVDPIATLPYGSMVTLDSSTNSFLLQTNG